MEQTLKVGAAKFTIIPALDQARRLGPKGITTDVVGEICARATVFDDGKTRAAVVLLDISEFFTNISGGIRSLASQWTDIPAENIMVCATHTHSSGRVIDFDDPFDTEGVMVKYNSLSTRTQAYIDMLCHNAASALSLAESRLKPAKGRIGDVSVPGIGLPRARMKDGTVADFNIGKGIKDIDESQIEAFSPYDDAFRVVVFEDMDGKPICGMGNFGCHNALAMEGLTIDSDYFGWAAERIEKDMGEGCVFSLMAGPEGNVHPAALIESALPPDKAAALVAVAGKMLYDGAKRIWDDMKTFETNVVHSASKEVYFPIQKPTPLRAQTYLNGRKVVGGKQDENGVYSELQIIRVGDFAILGLCGEVFHEIAMNLREASPFKYTWVNSLTNDELSYLMPLHEHKRDNESGKMNTQKEFAIPGEETEALVNDTYKELFARVK